MDCIRTSEHRRTMQYEDFVYLLSSSAFLLAANMCNMLCWEQSATFLIFCLATAWRFFISSMLNLLSVDFAACTLVFLSLTLPWTMILMTSEDNWVLVLPSCQISFPISCLMWRTFWRLLQGILSCKSQTTIEKGFEQLKEIEKQLLLPMIMVWQPCSTVLTLCYVSSVLNVSVSHFFLHFSPSSALFLQHLHLHLQPHHPTSGSFL